jgi:signal transduction histidine kinase/CheY-like chemotaxis protein
MCVKYFDRIKVVCLYGSQTFELAKVMQIRSLSSQEFRSRYNRLILLAWTVPPVFGLSFLVFIGMFTPRDILVIMTTPLEPIFIVANILIAFLYLRHYSRPIAEYLDRPDDERAAKAVERIRRFPLNFWGLLLGFLVIAPSTVILSAEWYAGYAVQPYDWFRIHLVALIVSIIVGLPIFFLVFDLFGKVSGKIKLSRPSLTIRTKVFLIGSLVPLLIDTMLVQYYWTRTGFFTIETFGIWLILEILAIMGSLFFVRSFGQSLMPLEQYVQCTLSSEHPECTLSPPQSTDELGVLTGHFEEMLNQQKALETQLLHSQKMEAVGRLSGGIAHDLNNILTVISGFGYLLHEQIEETDPRHRYVRQVLSSVDKASNLIQSLLAFSRKQLITPEPVNLNEIVSDTERFLERVIGEHIKLKTSLCDEPLVVMADGGQIQQVLVNLATNACDAMPDGGDLLIETGSFEIDDDFIRVHGYGTPGKYAVFSVSDTGEGMEKATKEQIFEPFFTTKEVGKGTGLGLAIVYGIMKQHKGFVNVYSEIGKGTTFKSYLPVTSRAPGRDITAETTGVRGGTETILIAEDDRTIRGVIKEILEMNGYSVIEAADGAEAIELFMGNKDRIALLITDVIMPRRNGKEVYDQIRKTSPEMKVLFLTGYSADLLQKDSVIEEGYHIIQKPVAPNILLRQIRELLDGE